jgi:hypothetical protein
LLALLDTSAQEPPQFIVGGSQAPAQAPALQTLPGGQAFPHAPQCRGSLARSTHAPPHDALPSAQAQVAFAHIDAGEQVWPHRPQSSGFVAVSTQLAPQRDPVVQPPARQAPLWQTSPTGHSAEHAPQ